jgi:hypothetical protein
MNGGHGAKGAFATLQIPARLLPNNQNKIHGGETADEPT